MKRVLLSGASLLTYWRERFDEITWTFPWFESGNVEALDSKSPAAKIFDYLIAFYGLEVLEKTFPFSSWIDFLKASCKNILKAKKSIGRFIKNNLYRFYFAEDFVFYNLTWKHIFEPFLCKQAETLFKKPVFVSSKRGLFYTGSPRRKGIRFMGCFYLPLKLSFESFIDFFRNL